MTFNFYFKYVSLFLGMFFSGSVLAIEVPKMVEETDTSGIVHAYNGGWEYYVGGGVAAFDCNGDGFPEIYLAGGSDLASLFINQSSLGQKLRFKSALTNELALENVTGAYPVDVNSDGVMDLMVLRVGENIVFKGLGNCQFERANEEWNFVGGDRWSTAFSATWEGQNVWPTFAVGNYVDRRAPGTPWGTCHDNILFKPSVEGNSFKDAERLTPGYCALSVLFSDWSRSGSQDLRVSNDRQYYKGGQEQLWNMQGSKNPALYSQKDGWQKLKIWGMGIASHDVTGDGRPEYFLTSMGDNKLRTLAKQDNTPSYKDMARSLQLTAHRPFVGNSTLPSTGWHAEFQDVNNDGFVDLFVAKGNVHAMSDFAKEDPNNLLLGSPSGKFREAAGDAGLLSFKRGRGAVVADLNLDGLTDVVVSNRQENVQIWRNVGLGDYKAPIPMGNWVALSIIQSGSNRNAIGAWVEIRAGEHVQRKELTIGGGHAGGQATWHHFGVGVAERATVRVQWPGGEWGPWIRLFANQFARVTKGVSVADIWLPPRKAFSLK